MRAIRAVAVALIALAVANVGDATAQSTRGFKDSWFWGVKGGGIFYQVQSDPDNSLSPLAGIDWLITRTNGGLYVSFDHTFFQDKSVFVNDSLSPVDTVPPVRADESWLPLSSANTVVPASPVRPWSLKSLPETTCGVAPPNCQIRYG